MATYAAPAADALPFDIRLMELGAKVLGFAGAVAVVVVASLWLVRQPAFAVRAIRVDGDVSHNSVSTIRANAAPRLAGNFFTLDLAQARAAFESVPWVRQAVVRRVWPNHLAVTLEEHRAAALWRGTGDGDAATDRLVNTHGEVFEANVGDVEDEALPTLEGPDGSSAAMLSMWQRLTPLLAPLDARIDTLTLSGRGSWRGELDTGATIEFGRGGEAELADTTQRFVATVTQVTSRYGRPIEYADLRHREGYAVRLRGITTTLTPEKPARK